MDASTNPRRVRRTPRWLTSLAGAALTLTAIGTFTGAAAAATPADTTSLTDDTGVVTIDVPAAWAAVSTTPTTVPAPATTTLSAAPTTAVAAPAPTTATVTSLPAGWQQLTDGTDLLTVVVPVSWTNIDTSFWTYDSTPTVEQPAIVVGDGADTDTAGTDAFRVVAEPASADLDAVADANLPSCTAGLRVPFDNGHFVGLRQDFTGCDGTDHAVLVVADPPDHRFTLSAVLYVRAGDEDLIDPVLGGLGSTTATPYYWLTDASDLVTTKVPLWWSEWSGGPNTDSVTNTQRPGLSASQPTIGIETEDGLVLTAFHGQTPDALAAANGRADRCTGDSGPVPYDDGVLTGLRRTWTDCDGVAGSQIVQVFASPADQSVTLALDIDLTAPDDGVLDLVLNSFNVVAPTVETTTTTVAGGADDGRADHRAD